MARPEVDFCRGIAEGGRCGECGDVRDANAASVRNAMEIRDGPRVV